MSRPAAALACALFCAWAWACAYQQVADPTFHPTVSQAEFVAGEAPRVLIDEAHYNFHTIEGRYGTFAELLRLDGCEVAPHGEPISAAALAGADLLVIANALNERNEEDWSLPTPSAFSDEEIDALVDWVRGGGALWLIADHMPFPGAAERLASRFGFAFENGFAMIEGTPPPAIFDRADGTLAAHPITDGRTAAERIERIASFTGQVFDAPAEAEVLLRMPAGFTSRMPTTAWEFTGDTPERDAAGRAQGAVVPFGEGRLAVFGEAAMFTAQVAGPEQKPMGLNHPDAEQNSRFALNVLHWLLGRI